MPNQILPEGSVETSYIYISVGLAPAGTVITDFAIDGMTEETAIGYLTTITDRLRDIVRMEWEIAQFNDSEEEEGET